MTPRVPVSAPEEPLRRWAGRLLAGYPCHPPPVNDSTVVRSFLRYHGVGPALAAQVRNDAAASWWDDFAGKRAVAVEMARRSEFLTTAGTLYDRVHPPPIVFKGQALAYSLYAKPWLRPRTDVDVLVDRDSRGEITRSLLTLGYRTMDSIDGDLILQQASFRRSVHGIAHTWDVHWLISNRHALGESLTYAEMAESAQEVRVDGVTISIPSLVDSLLIACAHLVGHHGHEVRLIWLYDIHLLVYSLSERQREEFLHRARSRTALGSACHAAFAVTFRYLPSDLTDELWRELDPGPGARASLTRSHIARLAEDARALEGTQRLALIRQHLFPSTDYMVKRFGIRRRWQLPFWYLLRICRAVPKLFRRR